MIVAYLLYGLLTVLIGVAWISLRTVHYEDKYRRRVIREQLKLNERLYSELCRRRNGTW